MKKMILLFCILVCFVSCNENEKIIAEYTIESAAMIIGYDLRDSFVWTYEVDVYYIAIMDGNINLAASQTAEAYLRSKTHPIIANRLVRLAEMIGFGLNEDDHIIDVSKIDIRLLQAAARGFREGILLN